MLGESAFLRALTTFAVVSLLALAFITAIGVTMDRLDKRRALRRAQEAFYDLSRIADSIRSLTEPYRANDGDLEMFVLATFLERGLIHKSHVRVLAAYFAVDPSRTEAFSEGVFHLGSPDAGLASAAHEDDAFRTLVRARRKLGTVPVAALEYVIEREPSYRSFPSAFHVVRYLRRYDLVERMIGSALRFPIDAGEEPRGRLS
jgi:hypothetical protein